MLRVDFEKDDAVPIWPLMLEVQLYAVIVPSGSVPKPLNKIEFPDLKLSPLLGLVIEGDCSKWAGMTCSV